MSHCYNKNKENKVHLKLTAYESLHKFLTLIRSGYTTGNWVPVNSELTGIELTDLVGSGVPSALDGGSFLRIGTNLRCWPPSNAHHPFNGDSMIHRYGEHGKTF